MLKLITYFGGKGLMLETLLKYSPKQHYSMYIEPFGGSGAYLLSQRRKCTEIYNDLDDNVYSLFKVLSDNDLFEQFKHKLDLAYYSEKIRNECIDKLSKDISMLERAFCFFYVNRTSFNGIGGFSINPFIRRNMSKSTSTFLSCIDGLTDFHNRLSTVIITQKDAFELLEKYNKNDVFFYLDPPYIHDTRTSNIRYNHEMTDQQHKELVKLCLESKAMIMMSCYDHEIYKPLKDKFMKINSIKNNGLYRECIYCNYMNAQIEEW